MAWSNPRSQASHRRSALVAIVAFAIVLAACEVPVEDAADQPPDQTITTTMESTLESATPVVTGEDGLAFTTGMVHSAGTQVFDGANDPLHMRCVNVDGWLTPTPYLVSDAGNALFTSPNEFKNRLDDVVGAARADQFWQEWRANFITAADFERISALGFNCVRLVIYYRAIATVENGEPVFDESVLADIDAAIDWGEEHGLYVVLDLHSAPGGQNAVPTVADVPSDDAVARLWEGPDAASNQAATVAIWRTLAERYAAEEWVAGYDLLNEPELPPGHDGDLVDLYARIIEAIRSVDPNHMVILEGDALATDVSVFDAPLDANLMYEFHAYALIGFEDWATPELKELQPYLTLRDQHDRPIWLGEFGEGSEGWIVEMVDLMEANDVGWAVYPWKRKQTLFWNPVLQRIDDMPTWYKLADYLAQKPDSSKEPPSVATAEAGMVEVLARMQLANTEENGSLAAAITR